MSTTPTSQPSLPGRLDSVYRAVARVRKFSGGQQVGAATGFHYQGASGEGYIVTNRHVVANNNPDVLVVQSIVAEAGLKFVSFAYPLTNGGRPTWRDIPGGPDIAVIPMSECDPQLSARIQLNQGDPGGEGEDAAGSVQHFLPSMLAGEGYPLRQGDPLMIVGFPLDLYDRANHFPIARGGILASVWGANFNNHKGFLVDSICHPGMSGSPVVSLPHAFYSESPSSHDKAEWNVKEVGRTRTTLVGIHFGEHLEPREVGQNEFYDYQDVLPNSIPARRGMMLSFAAYAHVLKSLAP